MSALSHQASTVLEAPSPAFPNGNQEMLHRAVERFLFREAEILDDFRLMQWLDMITPDIDYAIPVRITREDRDERPRFDPDAFHMVEDYGSLAARMKRFGTGTAWAESPPSKTRRNISNIRLGDRHDSEVEVRSNLLFFWSRDDSQILLSAERHDRLRESEGELRLARRRVHLDHVTLPLPNLSIVL